VKVFVDWLLARRQRVIIVAVVGAPLLPIVAAALIGLDTARRGVAQGLLSAALGLAGLLLLALLARTDLQMFAVLGAVSMGSGVVVGALIRRAGNLVFAFQSALLLCFAVVVAMSLLGPDPRVLFAPVIAEFAQVFRAQGSSEEQIAELAARIGLMLPGVAVFSSLAGALLLGYWWWTLAEGERRFAEEFRRLRLGRLLGVAATLVVVLGLVFSAQLVQNLTPLALFGFLFQGLAVLHAWAHAKRWHPGLLALVYFSLILPPLTVLVMLPLSVVGLVDKWFNLRAPLRSET
jgi:hypothetical protein